MLSHFRMHLEHRSAYDRPCVCVSSLSGTFSYRIIRKWKRKNERMKGGYSCYLAVYVGASCRVLRDLSFSLRCWAGTTLYLHTHTLFVWCTIHVCFGSSEFDYEFFTFFSACSHSFLPVLGLFSLLLSLNFFYISLALRFLSFLFWAKKKHLNERRDSANRE